MADVWGRLVDGLFGMPHARSTDIEVTELRIPMPDGAVLLADRYRPREFGSRPEPVVLIRTPYGHRTPIGRVLARAWARQGFQVVNQSVRGTFGSGGQFWPFQQEKQDGLATAAWLREQPWCDGRLAGAGASYLGFTEWALGPYVDPPLEAMCLAVTSSDFGHEFYRGGVVSLHNLLSWSALIGRQEERRFGGLFPQPVQTARTARAMSTLPLRNADRAAIGRPVRFWQEVIAHAGPDDDFWAPIDHGRAIAELTTPVSMVTGWYDLFLPGQLDDFTALAKAGRTVRITIGPWAHGDPGSLRTLVGDQASWLAAHLRGERSQLHQSPVRLYLQHANRWLDFAEWPPPDSVPTRLYLRAGHRLDWAEPAEPAAADSFVYDPADPTPSVGGPLLTGKTKQHDNRAIEARPDVLVYTGDPLATDLDLVGEVRASLPVWIEGGHGDVYVRLCDVGPDGVSRNVTDGIRRLRPGDGPVVEVDMFPTGYRFRHGHRLRVQVAGGSFPRFDRNQGAGEHPADALLGKPRRQEVRHDPATPPHLLLPVLSGR